MPSRTPMNIGHILSDVERVKRFVKVDLHCIVSNLKRSSKISTLPPTWKHFCRRPCTVLWIAPLKISQPNLAQQTRVSYAPCNQQFRELNGAFFVLASQSCQKRKLKICRCSEKNIIPQMKGYQIQHSQMTKQAAMTNRFPHIALKMMICDEYSLEAACSKFPLVNQVLRFFSSYSWGLDEDTCWRQIEQKKDVLFLQNWESTS